MEGMLKRCLCVLLLLAQTVAVSALAGDQVLKVRADAAGYPLGLAMDMLEDEPALLDIAAVSSSMYADRFRPVGRERPNFGFTRSAMWFRLQADFSAAAGQEWYLVEAHPILDNVTFYLPDGRGGWQATTMGDTLPFSARLFPVREFVVPVPQSLLRDASQPLTFYVRVAGQGAMNVDLRLVQGRGLAAQVSDQSWALGLFYGALLVMLLYNLILYASSRDRLQAYYLLFLGAFLLLFMGLNGVGLQYAWPDWPEINAWFPLFTCVAMWGGLQFTRVFLDTRAAVPRTDRLLRLMAHAALVFFLLVLVLPRHWTFVLGTILPMVFGVVMLVVGINRMRRGFGPARLFVAGWSVLLLGTVLLPLANLGVLPVNALTTWSPQVGVVLLMVMLSLAQGDRLRLLKQENERLQRESTGKLEAMFGRLRELDADKSRFLQYLGHELKAPGTWLPAGSNSEAASPALRAAFDAVESGQQRLIDLVGTVMSYFDLAGEDPLQVVVAPVAPMWLVDDILRERRPETARRNLKIHNRVPADLVVLAGERRLRRAFSLIIDNAIGFSEDGQEIEIVGGTETYGKHGFITVRDQGRGIAPDHLARLFEPFFMQGGQRRDGGFGLSLAIARLLVTHMQGDIRVHSDGRGHGAAFTVILPTASAQSLPDRVQSPAA